ncbi:MAG: UDP-N-acetylglucosamine--LPS N-acetylglucosamine transferase [Clostridiales bacterium]|nr:UDP-N-acetylglucosamine--LPS N-acetylglucosamine transferase [Clostridiales bacterium]
MKILIITSYSTGQGHKSITEAIAAQITGESVRVRVVDGFAIGNVIARVSGRIYNILAVYFPYLWDLIYKFCDAKKDFVNRLTVRSVEKGLLKVINDFMPDVIVSVHAAFVGSVIDILEKNDLHIPLISIIADLDNVTSLWSDKRAEAIICPTLEAKRKMLLAGLSDRLYVFGFPVREGFCRPEPIKPLALEESDLPRALLISGSQGSRRIKGIVKALLNNKICRLTVVTGSNSRLRRALERDNAVEADKNLKILGFTPELDKYMLQCDFVIARASPNVMMEAITLNKPIIAIDAFHGQEKKNPEFLETHKLGVYCKTVRNLPGLINELTANNQAKLNTIKYVQKQYAKSNASQTIARFILNRRHVGKP